MLVPHRVSREAPIGAQELLLERKAGDEALPHHVTSVLSMHFCLHTEELFKRILSHYPGSVTFDPIQGLRKCTGAICFVSA